MVDHLPPLIENEKSYANWKKAIKLWSIATNVPKSNQATVVALSLQDKARESALEIEESVLRSENGIRELLKKLDITYKELKADCFSAFLDFDSCVRWPSEAMASYITRFENRHSRLKMFQTSISDDMLGLKLLAGARLSTSESQKILNNDNTEWSMSTISRILRDISGSANVFDFTIPNSWSSSFLTHVDTDSRNFQSKPKPEVAQSSKFTFSKPVFGNVGLSSTDSKNFQSKQKPAVAEASKFTFSYSVSGNGVFSSTVRNKKNDDVIFVSEVKPTEDQRRRAEKLLLPSTFYLYENKISCDYDERLEEEKEDKILKYIHDRDNENLNSKLQQQPASAVSSMTTASTSIKSATQELLIADKKAGGWNCLVCYAQNEPSDPKCPCCGVPNPSVPKVEETMPSASTFVFGASSKPTEFSFGVSKPIFGNQQPVQSNSAKLSFGSTGYTFGQNKSTSATTMSSTSVFSIQTLEKSGTANPAATIPKPSHPQVSTTGVLKVTKRNGSWRCGSCYVENGQYDVNCKCCGQANPNATQAPGKDESSISQPLTTALPTTITDKSTFGFPGGATSFSDLIKSNTGGGFASSNKSGGWMGMPEQKPLFASMTQGGDDDDGTYPSEENADIHFEPIAKLPEKFKIVTGEEDEEELYSQRCKLYRFNKPTNEWKERGTGEIKLKRHIKNGRIRIVMRREQIFKVCANHYIRPDMKMDESKTSDRAWTWTAMDFSDNNEPTMEIFTVRFKNTDQTEKFKAKFDECQMMLLDVDPMTPCKARSMRSKELSDRAEKMKNESKFFKNKLSEQTNIQTENSDSSPTTHGPSVGGLLTAPIQQNARSLREKSEDVVKRSDDLILATPQKQLENSFALRGNKFSFQPKTDDNEKSPSRQHTTSADSNDPQAESDIQFEPIYQLPDHVEIITGEEDEQILFRNRAKLYMFHKETKQWKERGVGDIKILQHFSTYKVRVLMRREQVLKVCLNHFVQPEIKLSFKEQTSPKTLLWTATDFSDSEKPAGETLQFALRFENPDTASAFKNLWKEGAEADVAETLLEPDGSAINTTVKPGVTSSGAVAERPQRPVDQPKPTFSFANVPSPFDAATDEGPHEVMGFMFGSFAPQDFKFAFRYNTDNNQETTRRQQTLSAGSDGPQAKSYIYFKPFHQLPDYVEIRTGEEDEQILFRNRARLYMFRKETKQWKERGVGVIKILQHLSTLKSRILMRREQVLKVCLNHFVQSEIKLNFKEKTLHEVLLWTATDFSDSDKPTGETLQFALRFRNADIASTFKNQWEKSVEAAISETLLEPDESVIDTSTQRPRVTIPGMMVKNPQISIKQPKPKYRFTNVSSPLDVSTKYDEGTFEFMGYVFGKTAASKSTSTTDKFEYDISKISFNFDSDVTPQVLSVSMFPCFSC
ncbi:E3 SUMO-protein ligase RanBP2-like isoform X4 [Styela clava]